MSPPKTKDFVLQEFVTKEDSKLRIVIATVAFGMGIDVKDVTYVINWNAPRSIEELVQERKRAGRDGQDKYHYVYVLVRDVHLHWH